MRPSEIYDEKRVLDLLAQGSEYAFTQVFDHYRDKIYSIAIKFLKSPINAEEIVQDLFLKIWLKREDMNKVQKFESYLFIMARNMIFDRIKKISYEATQQKSFSKDVFQVNDTSHKVEDSQYQKMLHEAIEKLSPQQKQIYTLAKIEGLSRDEIAQQLNISPFTVKNHLARAVETIREYLTKNLNAIYIPLVIAILSSK